jgi:hypothetical protein
MVVISRFPVETQNYSLVQGAPISPTALVEQMDYLTLLVQSLQDQINRCIKLPAGFGPTFDPNLPQATTADLLLGVNSTNDGMTLTAGTPGPAGPAGAPGGSGAAVYPISSTTSLSPGSPVDTKYYPADASGGAFSANLPAALAGIVGQVFQVKKVDNSGNAVTVTANGGDNILGGNLGNTLVLDSEGISATLVCRAAGIWDVL